MQITVEIDSALLAEASKQFPPGTPERAVLEEALRRLAVPHAGSGRDPRVQRLVNDQLLVPRTAASIPPRLGGVDPDQVMQDLDADRSDR
jgi:hypothetical protein